MPYFVRGLAEVGARVLGIGDQPAAGLPEITRRALADYLRVGDLWNEESLVAEVTRWLGRRPVDRVECLWEPGMLVAARLREALGAPGLSVERTVPLRNKERMKQVLDEAGIRTPHHVAARSEKAAWEGAERLGYP